MKFLKGLKAAARADKDEGEGESNTRSQRKEARRYSKVADNADTTEEDERTDGGGEDEGPEEGTEAWHVEQRFKNSAMNQYSMT